MILWEIQQVATPGSPDAAFFAEKLDRISNYFDVLSSSFSVMQNGMQREQYNKFRNTLTPASGFQSAQYRLIEFASTNWMNLIDNRFRAGFDAHADLEKVYEHLYWQAAGRDHATGQRTTLIQLFEERYKSEFLRTLNQYRDCNLWATYLQLPEEARNNTQLKKAMRHYDFTVNVTWVMAHFHAAERYLDDGSGKTAEGTGGSNWKKYMHPRYQRRIFFPGLWTEAELADWGNTETEPELQ
jgi:tryptophan 2,3-dioxygenase